MTRPALVSAPEVNIASPGGSMLETYFGLRENGTTVRTEILAGFTTFLTMAYIMFVNPSILAEAGIEPGAGLVPPPNPPGPRPPGLAPHRHYAPAPPPG